MMFRLTGKPGLAFSSTLPVVASFHITRHNCLHVIDKRINVQLVNIHVIDTVV